MLDQDKKIGASTPPNLISALTGGFDAVANHFYLLLFPIALDVFLWLGPHIRIQKLVKGILTMMDSVSRESDTASIPDYAEMMKAAHEVWGMIAERFNLLTSLRTYPVGVPSLVAAELPITSPLGPNSGMDVDVLHFIGYWILFLALGLLLGTIYFSLTSQAALHNKPSWLGGLADTPRAFLQVIWLTLFLAVVLFAFSIPVMLLFTVIMLLAGSLGQWIILILCGTILLFLIPLLFSSHGIFVHQADMFRSILRSIKMVQFTLPQTSLFFLVAFVIMQGMNVVWQIPPSNSWISLIGIMGHAFIYTGLLASSFVYYRQADQWLEYVSSLQKVNPRETKVVSR